MATRIFRCSLIVLGVFALLWLFNSTTVTATRRPDDCGPPPTPELMDVEPVTSPTTLHVQTLYVRLGRGRIISATSEAGTVAITGTFSAYAPAPLTLTLSSNITHHITVIGQVEYAPACYYHLTRTTDKNGAPLTIVQQTPPVTPTAYLPLIHLDSVVQSPQVTPR